MNDELIKIVEGMQTENKDLTDNGKPPKYKLSDFDSVVKTWTENNPVKEAPTQTDVAVTEENTASNGEESSTDTQGNSFANSGNFELDLNLKKKEDEDEDEEEPPPEVSYQYRTAKEGDDFKSGWQKTTFEGPTGKERVEPVKQEEVPDEFYNNHIQTQNQKYYLKVLMLMFIKKLMKS